ncbi:hypothetical protein MKX01_042273 [Papaver californicum]|nr:hypothetical protein MKX01_042273 [Papaver californicum]
MFTGWFSHTTPDSNKRCLAEPEKPHYKGGIIVNPEFNDDVKGWEALGQGEIKQQLSNGNRFLVLHSRIHPLDSFRQKVNLEKDKLYALSAWIRISKGNEAVSAMFKTKDGQLLHAGTVIAKSGCWSMLKGGISANSTSQADLYFETGNAMVEIWADSISLKPFSKAQWRSHQDASIVKVRKNKVRFEVTDADGTKLAGVQVSIKQTRSGFPFGCAMSKNILTSTDYQNWFSSRFKYTTFANEMKWYSNEARGRGLENYTIPDAMVAFAKQNNISIRGHNVFWDNPKTQPRWLMALPPEEIGKASARRIDSVVSRYSGQLIAWDVVNENMHFSFFEDMLGKNASIFYNRAHQLDTKVTLFLNEYNTIENSKDKTAHPENYLKKLKEIQAYHGNKNIPFGIGLQTHFPALPPNLAYMRAGMDMLGSLGFPMWLTEVDEILREGYSNPYVDGMIIFSGPYIDGCGRMCMTDPNYKSNEVGEVVDKLLKEWKSEEFEATEDINGYLDTSLFHGDYEVIVTHPITNASKVMSFEVSKVNPDDIIHVSLLVCMYE